MYRKWLVYPAPFALRISLQPNAADYEPPDTRGQVQSFGQYRGRWVRGLPERLTGPRLISRKSLVPAFPTTYIINPEGNVVAGEKAALTVAAKAAVKDDAS
jgi:hypothetical protein